MQCEGDRVGSLGETEWNGTRRQRREKIMTNPRANTGHTRTPIKPKMIPFLTMDLLDTPIPSTRSTRHTLSTPTPLSLRSRASLDPVLCSSELHRPSQGHTKKKTPNATHRLLKQNTERKRIKVEITVQSIRNTCAYKH